MAKVSSAALKSKIEALQAQLVIVEAEEKASQVQVAVGDTLTYLFGRAATRKQYTGTVRGVALVEGVTKYKLVVGEGFEEEFHVIAQKDIVVGDLTAVDNEIQAETIGDASADPLALLS